MQNHSGGNSVVLGINLTYLTYQINYLVSVDAKPFRPLPLTMNEPLKWHTAAHLNAD